MDKAFIFNQSVNELGIKDAINERITKAQAISSCLLANNGGESELPYRTIYGVVWVIDELLEELEQLFGKLDKPTLLTS